MHPPSSWLKSPIRALVLTQILGQPCEFQVGGETKLWAARETQNLRQHLSFFEASIRRNCVRTVLVSVPSASAPCDPIKRLVPWSSWRLEARKLARIRKYCGSGEYLRYGQLWRTAAVLNLVYSSTTAGCIKIHGCVPIFRRL